MPALREQVLRRKPVEEMAAETGADTGHGELKRTVGLWSLSAIGIGGTIGTGIFFILSQAVPMAGPAVIWSFIIAGAVAGLTAVCYAELAGAVPVAGSSYSYTYATLGEFVAMGVGACLLLEWGVAGAAVAVGWSEYVNQFINNVFGVQIPEALSNAPEQGGIINVPAVVLIIMCALLLIRGVSESAKTNAVMVVIKI
ncbi:MAG: basic amino acid/polyamine antiporter, family, partial [Pseudonocardiales bacterium]|nr:basic amino acid/polyamine antiporter, family [Pseudonocardiales bacterium]